MASYYKTLCSPILFRLDPERAHDLVLHCCAAVERMGMTSLFKSFTSSNHDSLKVELFGKLFKNPFGLAAGFDKNGTAPSIMAALGFGHIEIGSVTAQAQAGNPRPRVFRYPDSRAVINSMGFPSIGAVQVSEHLRMVRKPKLHGCLLGINIGKTKIVPLDKAVDDYLISFSLLSSFADYVTINVSSPNTPELRKLQEPERLSALFHAISRNNSRAVPVLVKIAPDLEDAELDRLLTVCLDQGIAGIIATNTTFSREGLPNNQSYPNGGLSGVPLFERSLQMVRKIRDRTSASIPIVGVGGISNISQVMQFLRAGASLVQIYTALIYEGPFLVRRLERELAQELERVGANSVIDVIGSEQ